MTMPTKPVSAWRVRASLLIVYFVFAILLNSVGTVILQVINTLGVAKSSAAVLEAFKDLSIAATSFAVASFIPRLGFKRMLVAGLAVVAARVPRWQ
jgi:MFS transporter, FHS family, glucose/mannose:H+ symporter